MEIEIGTLSNPIIFSGVIAGQEYSHPNNPFYLWNDKGGVRQSVDAKNITVNVIDLNIMDELVGFSNGNPDQTFTVAYPPVVQNDPQNPLTVKVNGVIWTYVFSLSIYGNTDEVYEFNYTTGTVTFGDNINGKIPTVGSTIEISYTPNTVEYGLEIVTYNWLGIRSNGVISNPRTIYLERRTSTDASTIVVGHVPITSVSGVYLNTDSNRLGTNYYTGGSFDSATGTITLGTALPGPATIVLVDYAYTIQDDLEPVYTQIGKSTFHSFFNSLPSNNAKAIYLRLVPPATASPSGIMSLKFRIRLDYSA